MEQLQTFLKRLDRRTLNKIATDYQKSEYAPQDIQGDSAIDRILYMLKDSGCIYKEEYQSAIKCLQQELDSNVETFDLSGWEDCFIDDEEMR